MSAWADAATPGTSRSRVRRLMAPAAASALAMGATAYNAWGDPYAPGHFPGCMWLALTGMWCPGCGGLRATHELAHGDVWAALALNPVVVVVILPLLATLIVLWWVAAWRGTALPRIPLWLAVGLPVLLAVFWVLRNIPVLQPFLAP
ncbi:DUF2752 domain-containing protein [Demequina sp. B12]|uniref:DUF2752 domain-containing protein n=1 Tax=Demequina sp. B12 TaxID=2992757 RepID=UPI00237B08EC|nr:DUF2752 domain-containing protein [Demequina sp. B12]MDE0573189.1 DUF2752 domain-containing protein [Demequina sp. B12]